MKYTHSWGFPVYDPVCTDVHGNPYKPYRFLITEIKPGYAEAVIRWQKDPAAESYKITAIPYGGNHPFALIKGVSALSSGTEIRLSGLENGVDYEIQIESYKVGALLGAALPRWLRCGQIPGTVVNYIHPDDYSYSFSGRSTASPGLLKMPNGEILASHDIYWGDSPQNLTKLFVSKNNGADWEFICDLYPCFWGKPFWHDGALYMLACATECGDLLIGKSNDYGRTWSAPVLLYAGGTRKTGGPMRSALPVVLHKNRLWTSMDVGSYSLGYHDTVSVSVPADCDLLDAANWTVSKPLHYNPDWPGASKGAPLTGFLEGNIVPGPDGKLYNILRYETRAGVPPYGLAGKLSIDCEKPEQAPVFEKFIAFEGNLSKFMIVPYQPHGGYYALVNRVKEEPSYYRGRLTLMYSRDLEHWRPIRDLLDMADYDLPDWPACTAFQYPDAFIENGVIYAALRTAINGAYNYHNANYITFHTFSLPEKEANNEHI